MNKKKLFVNIQSKSKDYKMGWIAGRKLFVFEIDKWCRENKKGIWVSVKDLLTFIRRWKKKKGGELNATTNR